MSLEEATFPTRWPNWVDLVIVTVILRTCYSGVARGLLAEVVSLAGIASATALASNFYGLVAKQISPWWRFDQGVLAFGCFAALLLATALLVRLLWRRVSVLFKWNAQPHWTIQGLGLFVGLVRGLWWVGLGLLIALGLQAPYLNKSIQERSCLGPHLVNAAQASFRWVADRYPGNEDRVGLIPAARLRLPNLPEELRPSKK